MNHPSLEDILLMEEILHHLGCNKKHVKNGKNSLFQLKFMPFHGALNQLLTLLQAISYLSFEGLAAIEAEKKVLQVSKFTGWWLNHPFEAYARQIGSSPQG